MLESRSSRLQTCAAAAPCRSRRPLASLSCLLVVFLLSGGWQPAARAEEPQTVSREEYERVLKEIEGLRSELADLKEAGLMPRADGGERPEEAQPPPESTAGGEGGQTSIFDKPFLGSGAPRAYVGGYFDVEYRDPHGADHDFRLHRFVPSIYAQIHERIRFASELEIEDGSEVEVEFAFLDLLIHELINVRGGAILDPLGRFNLYHDSPINDLTDRPLVDEFVIPTTLREVGVGLFGTLSGFTSSWDIKYEAYLTSGFKGLASDPALAPAISREDGLREARPSEEAFDTRSFGDNNNSFAGVGRLSVSPLLGTELGASAHHGKYDEDGHNDLTIAAVDALVAVPQFSILDAPVGPIEFLGEGAYAFIERDGFAVAQGVPDDFWGYYAQANYHFMPSILVRELPALFYPESTFTLVARWGQVDLDGDHRRRLTLGINYRPIESTVIKFDYQFNHGSGLAPGEANDDAFLISLASYF